MTDPFSITAGAIGIAGVTLQGVTALLNDVQAIQNAPSLISSLEQDILAIQKVLQIFGSDEESSKLRSLSPDTQSALHLAIQHCGQACDAFRAKIKKWSANSVDGKLRWWDRARVGLFAEADVNMLRDSLAASKHTMNAALNTASLLVAYSYLSVSLDPAKISSLSTVQSSQEIKHTVETALTQLLETLDRKAASIDRRLAELTLEPPASPSTRDQGSVDQLNDAITSLVDAKQLLKELSSETLRARPQQKLERIHAQDDGWLIAGFANTRSSDEQVSQEIRDVSAVRGGRGIVGKAQGININEFFGT
ncbi:hypothetical protein BDW62DRAFT_38543 [Aspergillus aurantiobrunneus]